MPRIAIVGAGIVGAAIAFELSQIAELEVLLLDAKQPGQGSTQAALGILLGIISHKKQGRGWQLREQGIRAYQELLPVLEARTGQPISRTQGVLKLLTVEDLTRWQKLQRTRHRQGYPLEIWTTEQTRSRYAWLPDRITGAIYSPQDGQIAPVPLTQALITAAQQQGVETRFQTSILPLPANPNTSRLQQLPTAQGAIPVDAVIVTAGLGSGGITQAQSSKIQLEPIIGQAWHLQLPQAWDSAATPPVITTDDIHLVPLANRQVWLGATVEFPADCPTGLPSEHLKNDLWQKALAVYPFLQQAEILRHWHGKRPRPAGETTPVIRQLFPFENVLIASGHYRNGVLLAPGTAKEVCAWVEAQVSG